MKLVIVESPTKAKTIEKYLGAEYKVDASGGHIRDLPVSSLGVDIENNFEPKYVLVSGKRDVIKRLTNEVNEAEEVYLATDPDREGEAISYHLAQQLKLPLDKENRIQFNEISQKAVNEAINNPRTINLDLVNAQQARRVLDRLVGYKISPVLCKKIQTHLSAGRVQSVALRLICEREEEIKNFKKQEYWNIRALLNTTNLEAKFNKIEFSALLSDKSNKKIKINNEEEADKIISELDGKAYIVKNVKKTVTSSHPYPPFTTSALQQDASIKLGFASSQTMLIAQQLYEGFNIPGVGHIALVTYIRTDSVRISDAAQREALEFIDSKFGSKYVPDKPNVFKSRKAAQDAHEAIRPISLDRTPESLKGKIDEKQYKLYKLIYDRFLASQMADATYHSTSAEIANGEYIFKVNGKTPIFDGYTAVYMVQKEEKEDEEIVSKLPDLTVGQVLNCNKVNKEQKFTTPPSRYTEASLIKTLEEKDIGRPATYAQIISILYKRKYCSREKKHILPTELGINCNSILVMFFDEIINVKFTAEMENMLDDVESGNVNWQKTVADFYPKLLDDIDKALKDNISYKKAPEESDVICDKCGAKMVIREGKFGKFLACPNYPKCKNTKPIEEDYGLCPSCGGKIVKRISKSGKVFYGCSNYPSCSFALWDKPHGLCPKCGSITTINTFKGRTTIKCSNSKCDYSSPVKNNEE